MNLKLRKRLKKGCSVMMAVLFVFATGFQPEAGIVEAADTDIQVVDGMTIQNGYLLSYEGDAECVVVPEGVTCIWERAFKNCECLKEIKLPEGVKKIAASAFYNCKNLSMVELPESLTSICDGAFWNCTNLSAIELPETLTSIEDDTFWGCESLTEIKLPESITSIGGSAFRNCKQLKKIEIPEGVTVIDWAVFRDCESLTEVKIPESVTSIEASAFFACESLREINIPESVTSMGDNVFTSCRNLRKVKIPEGVTSIGDSFFSSCTNLREVEIPDSVTSIGEEAFKFCWNLSEIELPEGLKRIEKDAFLFCEKIKEIKIPDSVTYIETHALGYKSGFAIQMGGEYYAPYNGFTIIGGYGTYAEKYAKKGNFTFRMEPVRLADGESMVSSKDFYNWIAKNREQDVVVINEQDVSFVFRKGEMRGVWSADFYDFGISFVTDYTELLNPKFSEEEFVLGIRPVLSGEFPEKADLIIPVNEKWIGKTLYVYSLSEDGSCQYIGKGNEVSEAATITVENADGRSLVFSTKAGVKLGDVDGDGKIDSVDALAILRYEINIPQEIFIEEAADANRDGSVNSGDALTVLRHELNILEIQ